MLVGHPLGHKKASSFPTLDKEWFSLTQQLSIANSFSAKGQAGRAHALPKQEFGLACSCAYLKQATIAGISSWV